ncbi:GAF domain-containing protein [Oricola thermophila]|uniref:Sigma-54-dependent Fis family transcriptional regulator n=1 Tax=Oricola thermophila TaxID=2742145 RepID=A0A6N1VMS2_9HYPH|nr:GAF domain-containing protein [Oricola thermophila]QKV20712.1 sigma-54-dependent Fis family transcriptional regulator [Oricola thermophila]
MVIETVQSSSAAAVSSLAASWRRSLVKHGLDPASPRAPDRVDAATLKHRRAALDRLMAIAQPRLDQLFGLVGNSGCGVLLTDADGVVLDQRVAPGDAETFESWGLCTGAVWSEETEGTNGIGTCLVERRQVVIHRSEHFLARNTAMSCMDAPIHGADGRLIGALDVSSCRADQTEGFARLIAATVAQTARQIENDNFRAAFPEARIIVASERDANDAVLLAVDEDDIVIGATHAARRIFGLGSEVELRPQPASDLLGRSTGATGFERAERAALKRALARAGGNHTRAARALGISRATLYRRLKRLGAD